MPNCNYCNNQYASNGGLTNHLNSCRVRLCQIAREGGILEHKYYSSKKRAREAEEQCGSAEKRAREAEEQCSSAEKRAREAEAIQKQSEIALAKLQGLAPENKNQRRK